MWFAEERDMMAIRLALPVLVCLWSAMLAPAAHAGGLVWGGIDGHLLYAPDARADRIPDFSNVGYRGGMVAIPHVATKVTVSAGGGDDTGRVQAAIDQVAAMPIGADGFRGAVLLKKGSYDINGQITIRASGIVLRGESRWEGGSVLHARGSSQRPLILVSGSGSRSLHGPTIDITDKLVPVGARSFHVSSTEGLDVGDCILITRPSTANWIKDTGMDKLDNPWQPGSKNLEFDRVVTRIEGNLVMIDAPLTNSLERTYGGATLREYTWPGRIENVGVEKLRGESDYDSSTDESHSWDFVRIEKAQHAWVRETKARFFAYAHVYARAGPKWVTVDDGINHNPVSQITGGRRYAFAIDDGELVLFRNCESRDGRHDYVLHSLTTGPNVFLRSVADDANSDSGPHHRWATGALFDNITVNGNELNARDRGNSGTGHGWAGANMVAWNSKAQKLIFQNPPTAQNWAIGCQGTKSGNGIFVSHGTSVKPASLYEAQLAERKAHEGIEYREYWLGDIDGFYSTGGTGNDVYVDPAWRAQIAESHTVSNFDHLVGNVWVPFTFAFRLDPGDLVVAASLSLGLKRAGGLPNTDAIYVDSLGTPRSFSSLGWSVGDTANGYVLDLGNDLDCLQDGTLNVAVQDDTAIDWAVLNLQVVPNAAPTVVVPALAIEMQAMENGKLNVNGPAPRSLGIVGLEASPNPATTRYAIQAGTDPSAGWLRIVARGGRTDVYPDGAVPEWRTADEWRNRRLRGVPVHTTQALRAKAVGGNGIETALQAVASVTTNLAGDVNRSGGATALDYALIRSAILRGGEIGVDVPWACDVNDDGVVNVVDLVTDRHHILHPPATASRTR